MTQSIMKKLDSGNRLLLPKPFLKQLGIEDNTWVYIVKNKGEDFLRIYKCEEETEN